MEESWNTVLWEVKRETSPYNKYMKWLVCFCREDLSVLSRQFFKTQKEAQACVDKATRIGEQGFPNGYRLVYTQHRSKTEAD